MMEFLFHDNRLYADMDKNQRYSRGFDEPEQDVSTA